jgi:Gpi18-like mannosyltransferase
MVSRGNVSGLANRRLSAGVESMDAVAVDRSSKCALTVGAIILVGAALRLAFLNVVSPDAHYYLLPWFEQLSAGGAHALQDTLTGLLGNTNANYAPPYYYLLWFATYFVGTVPPLWLIKFVSFCFDPLGAFFAYKIVRLTLSKRKATFAAALVFSAPTAIMNDGWFGQCDMIWTSLVLGSLYFNLQRKYAISIAFFALAFSFKAQAIFFTPFLFMFFVRGEIKFWTFGIAPLVYAAMLLPAIMLGVYWRDAATTYIRQGDAYHWLSSNAPNLYYFFADHFYTQGLLIGLALATFSCLYLAVLPRFYRVSLDTGAQVLAATTFLALSPFLLPKMHDRYFFAADMTSILLAINIPRLWAIPVILQISSFSAYGSMISWSFVHRIQTFAMPMAVMLCTVVVSFLVYEFWRMCTQPGAVPRDKTKPLLVLAIAIVAANFIWEAAVVVEHVALSHVCQSDVVGLRCIGDLAGDWMLNGRWSEWVAFGFIQIVCLFATQRLVAQMWALPWDRWFSSSCFSSDKLEQV